MILRALGGSITKTEANAIYDRVYGALHEGTAGYVRNAAADVAQGDGV